MQSRFTSILAGALSACVLAITPTVSLAHDGHGYFGGDRFDRQDHRIARGMYRDEISPWEARKLARDRAQLRRARYRMLRDDGRLSWRERARLERMENELKRDVYRYRYN